MKVKRIDLTGDLYDEQQILQWLMTQKDPSGEVIEALEGEDLLNLIRESESLAVYFCKFSNNFTINYQKTIVNSFAHSIFFLCLLYFRCIIN